MTNQPRSVNNSIAAIAAGFGAFCAAGGIAFGAMYVVFFILSKPDGWEGADIINCWLIAAVVGSLVSGYVSARVAKRNQFTHSSVVIATPIALGWWCTRPYTDWQTVLCLSLVTVLLCLLFLLGTWIGSRKRSQIETSK